MIYSALSGPLYILFLNSVRSVLLQQSIKMEDPQRISASYSKEHRGGQDIVPAGGNHPVRRPHPEESSDFESKGPLQVAIVMTTLCVCKSMTFFF